MKCPISLQWGVGSSKVMAFVVIDALSNYEFYKTGVVEKPVISNNHIHTFIENGVRIAGGAGGAFHQRSSWFIQKMMVLRGVYTYDGALSRHDRSQP